MELLRRRSNMKYWEMYWALYLDVNLIGFMILGDWNLGSLLLTIVTFLLLVEKPIRVPHRHKSNE